jgi:ATP-dependent RNA helicase RhlE
VKSATVFGGVKPRKQEQALRAGVDIVVATPGRLLDLMQGGHARFADLDFLVLDEADRMLDMGFLPDVRRILARLPKQRQTMLFSATLPRPIVKLSNELLQQPVRIDVERRSKPATGVSQAILPVPEHLKTDLLNRMITSGDIETALVFTRTKHRANRLAQKLERAGVSCDRIHGNRSQPQREAALSGFKNGRIKVLVATDIAARGIDVAALPHVINFDVPVAAEDYIHRVGRTARAGKSGKAVTLACERYIYNLEPIESYLNMKIPTAYAGDELFLMSKSEGMRFGEKKRKNGGRKESYPKRNTSRNKRGSAKSSPADVGSKFNRKKTPKTTPKYGPPSAGTSFEERIAYYNKKYGEKFYQ